VDHPAQLSAHQPWRSAALVAATIAAVELFLLVVLGFAFGAKLFSREVDRVTATAAASTAEATGAETAAPQTQTKAPAETATPVILPRNETSVMVLNGNGIAGAASVAAERVQRRGYIIAGTTNAPRTNFRRSIVMYRPGREGEAQRLARDLKVKRVAPLDGVRIADLQGAHVALIIGR
jgi:LytR cell envelope-related transcriptional attenuator